MNRREFMKDALMVSAAGVAAGLVRPAWGAEGAAGAGKYQIGCYTRPWAALDYRAALDGIAAAGYKYAGLMTTTANGKAGQVVSVQSTTEYVAAVAEEVKKRGLKTLSIYGGDFNAAKGIETGMAGLKHLIDISAICGCPNLLLGGTTNEKLYQDYYKVVAECCGYAAEKGVGLSVKPHGGQNSTGAQCRTIIETVGKKNFQIWYDPGNIYYYSKGALDPVEDAPSVDGLVAGMSVKDFKPPQNVDVTPGTGMVKFREVFAKLQKGGFNSGPLVVECVAKVEGSEQILAEAKAARKFLVELLGAERVE